MINTDAIRSKVLDLAIQGKLTENQSEDGNAEDLYAQIQAKKAELIKAGIIKAEKALAEISPNEVPFTIPDNWKWVRLGDYCQKVTDQVASGSFAALRENVPSLKEPDYALMVKTADFANGFTDNLTYTTKHGYEFLSNSNLFGGELILSNIGSIGKCFIVPNLERKMTLAPNSIMVRLTNNELRDYLYYFIVSKYGYAALDAISTGIAVKKFNKTSLKTIIIPVPPLAEQKRIVDKIESIYNHLDAIDILQLKYANDLEVLKSKIIDAGIQGKLTEHLPEDEDVEELFAQIQAEKIEILRTRQGRADKNIKEDDENYLFEIKDNWKWIKFAEVGLFKKGPFGSALTKSMFVPKSEDTVKVYEQQHAIQKDETLGRYYITRQYFEDKMSGFEVLPGDIIISCAGTIGETYIMPDNIEQGIINQALMRITLVPSIDKKYFLYYFDSNLKASAQKQSNGMAIKNIPPFDVMKNWYFPLPPLAEQKRIVETIESIMRLLG